MLLHQTAGSSGEHFTRWRGWSDATIGNGEALISLTVDQHLIPEIFCDRDQSLTEPTRSRRHYGIGETSGAHDPIACPSRPPTTPHRWRAAVSFCRHTVKGDPAYRALVRHPFIA